MNRLIICAFAVVSLHSFGAAGPISLSSDNRLPSFLRAVHGKDLEISVRCIEDRTPDLFFKYGKASLLCVLVGHANPHVRKQVLDAAERESKGACTNYDQIEYLLYDLRGSALESLSAEELAHPTQLHLVALLMSCSRKESSLPIIEIVGENNQECFVDERFDLEHVQDSVIRCSTCFTNNLFAQELLRREEAGECDQSVVTDVLRRWAEEKNEIAFEIDREGICAYFEERNSRTDHKGSLKYNSFLLYVSWVHVVKGENI